MRVPEHERDLERPDERRGQDGVDRAHVGDDGAAAETRELGCQRPLEPEPPAGLRAGAERPHAAVRGQRLRNGAVREHHHLVDAASERGDHRHGRRESGMPRIDLLGDEEKALQPLVSVPSGAIARIG